MAHRERCPKCGSSNITGRGFDTSGGDEHQERYCYDCRHMEHRLRSEGGVSWYADVPLQPPHRLHTATGLERTLVDEVDAAPDDDNVRSIYADWLIEHGDMFGTFIALQLARARERDPFVSEEEQLLLDRNWSAWIGAPSTYLEARHVEYERGWWSTCDMLADALPESVIADRAWSTVRTLKVGRQLEPQLPRLLEATRRSLRTIWVPSREAFALVASSRLALEEVVLAFDVSRDPPPLDPITALPALRTIGVHCEAELAERWLERIDELAIPNAVLVCRPHVDYLRQVFRRVTSSNLARLSIEMPDGIVLHATRDSDNTIAIRSIELRPQPRILPRYQLLVAKQALVGLEAYTDRLKATMPSITAELAQYADELGVKLVRGATSFAARPRR